MMKVDMDSEPQDFGLDEIIKLLREKIAITVSVTVAKIGFAPDDLGPPVKDIIAGKDQIAFIVLGCGLDEAREKGNWEPVRKAIESIKKGQKKNESGRKEEDV